MPRHPHLTLRHSLLLLLLLNGTSWSASSAASTLDFRWPVPSRVLVSMSDWKDSARIVLRWTMRIDTTATSEELRVSNDNVEILQTGDVGPEGDAQYKLPWEIEALTNQALPFMISRAGDYLRPAKVDAPGEYLRVLRSRYSGQVQPDSVWKDAEAVLRNEYIADKVATLGPGQWRLWVEDWLGLDLDSHWPLTSSASLPTAEVTVPGVVSTRRLDASKGSGLVWMEREAIYDGPLATRLMEQYLRSTMRSSGAQDLPDEPMLRSFQRRDRYTVALEPGTTRPSYARFEQNVEFVMMDGIKHNKPRVTEYMFDWSPPLGRAGSATMPDSVLAWYRAFRFEEAARSLVRAVAEGSRQADVHAMLGEVYRRMDRPADAVLAARRALSIDPRHAFAHEVLADAFSPRLASWYLANSDSSWAHLLEGIACDSTDGNLWLSMYTESLQRNRPDLTRRSLRSLYASHFFTPSALAYARWMADGLPKGSILLTNGDMDSYPLWCLQEVEGLRTDVAVVNRALLNVPWYARYIRDRYSVPLPFKDAVLDSLRQEWWTKGAPSDRIVAGWAAMKRTRVLSNPLHLSVTLDEVQPVLQPNLRLVGASWEFLSDPVKVDVDTVAVRRSLQSIHPSDFRGPIASERDRSPVRQGSTIATNVVSSQLMYAGALFEAGRQTDAMREISRARLMAQEAGIEALMASEIEKTRQHVAGIR
jgi:hypothetical protein